MKFDSLGDAPIDQLVDLLGPHLANLTGKDRINEGEFTVHESCRVSILDLPRGPTELQPEAYLRDVRIWHHQIHRAGRASYYARSELVVEPGAGPRFRLLELAESKVAEAFDATLAWLDGREAIPGLAGPATDSSLVRLLIVPRQNFFGFALIEHQRIWAMVPFLRRPNGRFDLEPASFEARMRGVDRTRWLAEITALPTFFGIESEA